MSIKITTNSYYVYICFSINLSNLDLLSLTLCRYVCIYSVFHLHLHFTALTCNLILMIRKFVSVSFSIWYFNNDFSVWHVTGSCCVLLGVLMYMSLLPMPKGIQELPVDQKKTDWICDRQRKWIEWYVINRLFDNRMIW